MLHRTVLWIILLSIWFTWYELCWGYGYKVFPDYFRNLYWVNIGILFGVVLGLALRSWRLGFALAPLVGILEDTIITTIHRAHQYGLWYALTHWNLRDHPYFGSGTAWFINTWSKTLLGYDPGLGSIEGFAIAVAFAILFPVLLNIDRIRAWLYWIL